MQPHATHGVQLYFAVKSSSLWRGRKGIYCQKNSSLKSWPSPCRGGKFCVVEGTASHTSPSSPGGDAALSRASQLNPVTSSALPPGAPVKPPTASESLILQESQTVIDI